jgi:hypothetical protein
MTEKREFYRYFAIDYVATGEGRSVWLKICRNYLPIDNRDRQKEKFVKFVGEDEFLVKYGKMVSDYIVEMIARKDQPAFTWETHLHFNYS